MTLMAMAMARSARRVALMELRVVPGRRDTTD